PFYVLPCFFRHLVRTLVPCRTLPSPLRSPRAFPRSLSGSPAPHSVTLSVPSFPFRRFSILFGHIVRSLVPFQALQHPIRSHWPFPRSLSGSPAPHSVTLTVPSFPFRRSSIALGHIVGALGPCHAIRC